MWSCGCVLYELLTLRHPFPNDNCAGLREDIVTANYDQASVQSRTCQLADLTVSLLDLKVRWCLAGGSPDP